MRAIREGLKRVGVLALSVMLAVGSSNLTAIAAEVEAGVTTPAETSAAAQSATDPAMDPASVTESETESEEGTAEEPEEEEETTEAEEEKEDEEKLSSSFSEAAEIDGVTIRVTAAEGVFPEGATLSVSKAVAAEEAAAENAVDDVRSDDKNVAASYTYDIKVLDKDGNEIQPADSNKVTISFTFSEVADPNLSTDIYHIKEDAEALSVSESGSTATAETDGFSLYTVEFTYTDKQYVLPGDSEVALSTILEAVGLSGEVTDVSVSDDTLFSASQNEGGQWIVKAHKAFDSEEWMKVTISDVEYQITVTDDQLPAAKIGDTTYGTIPEAITAAQSGNTIILLRDEDISAPLEFPSGKTLTLDLNGHTIDRGLATGNAERNGNVITVEGDLTITDSSEDRTGKLTGGNNYSNGGGVRVCGYDNAVFTLNGGSITGCKSDDSDYGHGGGVFCLQGKFIMNGGSIDHCTGIEGGGVYVDDNCTFNMTGGTISQNSGNEIGGVYVLVGTFNMTGGTISGNTATGSGDNYAGGVCINKGTFKVSGTPVIKSNTKNGSASNIVFYSTSSDKMIKVTDVLGTGAEIHVNAASGVTVAQGSNYTPTSSDAAAFHSDSSEDLAGVLNNNDIEIGSAWSSLQNMLNAGGTVTLNRDYTAGSSDSALVVPTGKTVTLDLNGHTIDRGLGDSDDCVENGNVITVNGTLTLIDSTPAATHTGSSLPGGGVITGGKNSNDGGGVYVAENATFTMEGGTITRCTADSVGGGVSVYRGAFTMTGGTITHCTADIAGGGVNNNNTFTMTGGSITGNTTHEGGGVHNGTSATFTMSGGSITGNAAYAGGGVYNYNMFTMTGGSITGNTVTGENSYGGGVVDYLSTFNVSGKPVISDNTGDNNASDNVRRGNNPINVTGALENGAKIYVTPGSVPTVAQGSNNYTPTASDAAAFYSDSDASLVGVLDGGNIKLASAWGALQTRLNAGGTVTLNRDYTAGSSDSALVVPTGKTVTLDLNGHTIDRGLAGRTAVENGNVVTVNGNLTLKDSGTDGTITGGNNINGQGGGVYVDSGTFTMQGGTISENQSNGAGGGVYVDSGTFSMTGGRITDNNATGHGGGVCVSENGTFNVSGTPVISGNYTEGVWDSLEQEYVPDDDNPYSEMDDVTLGINGHITVVGELTSGASIYLIRDVVDRQDAIIVGTDGYTLKESDAAYFHIDAGENYVAVLRNGGIKFAQLHDIRVDTCMHNGTIETSSTPAAAGATVTLTITPDSGYVLDTLTVTAEGDENLDVSGTGNTRTFTMPDADVTVEASFAEAIAQVGDVKYTTVQGAIDAAAAGDTVTLLNYAYIDESLVISSGKTVTLDLHNHGLEYRPDYGSSSVIIVNGNLTLTDSEGGGGITGGHSDFGGGVYVREGATFNMTGGSITGNTAEQSGGGVYVEGGGTFTMTGGSITSNEAGSGGGVFVDGSTYVGTRNGIFNISGSPVIKDNDNDSQPACNVEFELDSMSINVIGELTSGADICVTVSDPGIVAQVSGPRTTALSSTEASYFHSDVGSYIPTLSDSRVVFKTQATFTSLPEVASGLIYSGEEHDLLTDFGNAPTTVKVAVTTNSSATEPTGLTYGDDAKATDAGTYYIWYYAEDSDYYVGTTPEKLGPVTIAMKAATVTASAQSVEVNDTIVQDVSKATLTGAVSGHTLNSVTLTASDTSAITANGTITPSDAVIKDASGNNVTSNYYITYTAGTLAVTSPQVYISGISAESREYNGFIDAPLSGTGTLVIKKVRDDTVVDGLSAESIEAAFADANAGDDKTVTISSATLIGDGAGNYTLNLEKTNEKLNLKANITKAIPDIRDVTANELNDSTDASLVELVRGDDSIPGTLALTTTSLRYGRNEDCTWRFTPTDTTNYETITGTVDVTVNDTLKPTGEVSIKESAWSTFLNTITFGWYKLTDKVRITASDSGSGVDKVYYFISENETPLTLDQVTDMDASDWTEYSSPIAIDHDARCIVYVKIEDVDANVTYISSDGLSFDSTAPTIAGATDGASYVYGNDISLTVTDSGELDTVKINGVTKTASETVSDAGSYTVIATDKAGNTTIIAFTITKAPITVNASIDGWTYGTSASTPVVTGNSGNGTVTYEYKVRGAADSTYTTTVPVNHGDYTLRATVAATDNYQGGSATADFEIAKADATLSQAPVPVSGLSYTGSLQELLTAGTVTGGTIQYKLGTSGTYGASVPKAKDAGNYTVYYKVVGDQNHNDIAETSVAVSIAQQTTSITTTPVSKHYGDSAFAITGVTNNVGATPTYTVTAGTDVISISGSTVTILKPGSATITASIPVSTNYTAATATIAVTVANGAAPVQPAATMTTAYANDTVSKVSLPTGWTWADEDRDIALTVGTAVTAHAEYTAADAAYYEGGKALEITITRQARPATPAETNTTNQAATAPATAPTAVLTPVAGVTTEITPDLNTANTRTVNKTRTDSRPHLQGHNEVVGWNAIENMIKESKKTTGTSNTFTIDMQEDTKIPVEVFKAAKGSDVTLVFKVGDKVTWSVNGTDITDDVVNVDLGVSTDTHNIPAKVVDALTGNYYSTQISLDYDGEFGFKATLTMDMGSENAGMFANLFYFNPDSENLEFICAGEIGEDGKTNLLFTHASDYLIVVADESMETAAADLSVGNTETSKGDMAVTTETPEKGWNPVWFILLAGVVILVGAGAMIIWKKSNR